MAFVRRHGFKIAVLALCAAMGFYLFWSSKAGEKLPVVKAAPDFQLAGLDGNVTLADSDGKVRLFYFFFANCPDICPITTALAKKVQDDLKQDGKFGSDVVFNWITIDPKRDTLENMSKYAKGYGADLSGWNFLRGEPDETVKLARDFGLDIRSGDSDELLHQDRLILVDRKGKIREYVEGSQNDADGILAEIKRVL